LTQDFWDKAKSFITTDNIALLSVIITAMIFIINRHAELRYKKHDDKKAQYIKLIELLNVIYTATKNKKDIAYNIMCNL